MGNGKKKVLIGLAKTVIVILIVLLVFLMLYGVRKIGDIFRTDSSSEGNEISRGIEVASVSVSYEDDLGTKTDIEETENDEGDDTEYKPAENESETNIEPTFLLDFDDLDLTTIPEYSGEAYIVVNENIPEFTEADKENPIFENYSHLDNLGRCGVATANLGLELMPTEDRGSIGNIKPSGWHTIKYPDIIDDLYLTMVSSVFGIAIVALPAGIITAGYMDALNEEKSDQVKTREVEKK